MFPCKRNLRRTIAVIRALVLAVATLFPWDAGAAPPAFSKFFSEVGIEDLTASSRSAMIVERTVNGPGLQCGLRDDDRVLAINGQRIYSCWEFDYVRNSQTRERDLQMDLVVNRRGYLVPLTIQPLMPIRRLGFFQGNDQINFDDFLKAMGVTIPKGAAASLRRIPVRATYALEDWLQSSRTSSPDIQWLNEFVELRTHLANQDWHKVRPRQHDVPVPYLQKLSNFYLSVAARHRDGEETPDPDAHGVSLAYYVFHYPFPKFAPPLGSFDSSDKRFLKWVKLHHADTTHIDPPDLADESDEIFRSRSDIEHYLERVKLTVTQPSQHGGRRHLYAGGNSGVLNDNVRPRFIKKLEALAAVQDRDECLYRFALATLYGLDGNADALVSLVDRLRDLSPYMAYRSVGAARFAWVYKHKNTKDDQLNTLLTYLQDKPLQVTARKSVFYEFVIPRSRHLIYNLENFVGEPKQSGLIYHPISFASAFGHVDTLEEEGQALDTAIARPNFARHRAELLKRVERLAIPYATPADMSRLAQLGRDGLGRGMILDSFINIAYSDFMSNKADRALTEAICTEMLRKALRPTADDYDGGFVHVHSLIANLDDDDPAACRDQLLAAYADHGDVATASLIAAALESYGFEDLASEIRSKLDRFAYAVLSRTVPYGPRYAHYNVETAALCANDLQLETRRNLYFAVRAYLDAPAISHEPIGYLLAARYVLERGKLTKAADFLIQSFSADGTHQCRPLYFLGNEVTESDDEFRVWLLKKITSHESFDDTLREKLADSAIAKKMPELARELGISPDAPTK